MKRHFVLFYHMITEKRKYILLITGILISALLAGLCGGRLLGNVMLQQLVLQQSSLSIFIVRPVAEYRYVMNLLSSENELDRLAGYYSLSTYGMVDNRFLEERFKREGSEYIKRTIIWLISNKMEKRNIHFFSEIFKTTSRTVKEQILESIYRYDKNEFNRFIDENNVSTDLIKDIVGQESL